LYAGSGILFVPDALPEQVRYYLSFNPLLQMIEWMRVAYYPDYPTLVLDKAYIFKLSLPCLAAGLIICRIT
jgi:ABC-type polysaccharide/polyol phosphate export systems, permease component